MDFTDDERRVLDAVSHKRGVIFRDQVAVLAEAFGVDSRAFGAAWTGLIEKGKLRRICDDAAEFNTPG